MSHALVRTCQGLSAAAAVFTVLWACGRSPTRPADPPVFVRTIHGTWDGQFTPRSAVPPDGTATMTIAVSANVPIGTLRIGSVTYETDRGRQGAIDESGAFDLHFSGPGPVTLRGVLGADGGLFAGSATGLGDPAPTFSFAKR